MAADTSTASKRSKQAPSTAASLPEEIVSEILLLLPSRSILRFRAVCRSWAALLSFPAFKDVYAAKARARARRMDKFVVFAPSPDANGSMAAYSCAGGASAADLLFTVDRVRVDFMCLSSKPCHGAMLFSDTRSGVYWVCNPSTGECVPLPEQRRGLMQSSAGLVYDDRTKERKVVHLFKDRTHFGCEIYVLCNPAQRWRPAKQDVQLLGFNILKLVLGTEDLVTKVAPVFANGSLHWLAYPDNVDIPDGQDAILCFSVDTETFTRLNAPSSVHVATEYRQLDESLPAVPMHLAELEGSLCLVHDLRRRGQARSWLDLWMLRDRVASEWSLNYRIAVTPILARDLHSPRFITVLGCSSGGDSYGGNEQEKKKILIATSQHQVHAYDPNKGGIQLVLSARETNIRIGQKEAAAALWLGLYEDNLVRVEGGNRRDKEALSAVTKIIARLPVKSIAHSMLVCKQWRSLIESESFITSHMLMSMQKPMRIFMVNNGCSRRAFFDFASVENWLQDAGPFLASTLVKHKIISSKPCGGLNLISTNTDDFVCNPCTGAIKCLGRYGKSDFIPAEHHRRHAFSVGRNIGFGFDQSAGDHVAVEIGYINGTLACMIKTSSEKQWSCIGKPPRMVSDMPPAHVDGTLYWMSEPGHERVIVALDISTREFNILPCEESLKNDRRRHAFLVELKGTLSLVAVNASVGEMVIWMMLKNVSSWVGAYKICLGHHPDYSLAKGQVVMPVEIDEGRILLNTGRALGYYDSDTGELDSLYSLDQLKLPRGSLAFPVLCQESLARIQDDELPCRVAPPVRDQGCRRCEHAEHADTRPGQGRHLLPKCEGSACIHVATVYRSCCRRLFCESCQSRCVEHCQTHALRRDPMLPPNTFDWTIVGPDSTLPFCHPSVPGPEYCYYYTTMEEDVVRHVYMSLKDYMQGKQSCRWVECGYTTDGKVVKETWVRSYLRL